MSQEQLLKDKEEELRIRSKKLQRIQENLRKYQKLHSKFIEIKDKKEADFTLLQLNNA